MKRMLLLALVAMLCLAAACGETAKAPETGTDETAVSESDTVTPEPQPGEEPEEDTSGTDTPDTAPTDFTGLLLEQCVADAWPFSGVLPDITLDCPGAEAINAAIDEEFTEIADDPMWDLHYEVYQGAGRVLSVLMVQAGPNDCVYYTPYNLDLTTGEALTAQALLALLGVDEEALATRELTLMGEAFDSRYGEAKDTMEDTEFYDGQRAATTDPGNADTERIWIGEGNELYFAGRIYALAGAEYYESPLATGMVF